MQSLKQICGATRLRGGAVAGRGWCKSHTLTTSDCDNQREERNDTRTIPYRVQKKGSPEAPFFIPGRLSAFDLSLIHI